MRKPTLYLLLLLTASIARGQQMPWNAYFGNEGAEFAYDIKQTSDNGYIIAAYGSDGGSSDFYIVKLDIYGSLIWERIISKDNYSDRAFSILETQEGDYVAVGNATSFDKPWLVKLNSNGDTLWTTQWTNTVTNNTGLLARGALLPDGRIVVVSHEDYYALDPYMFIVSSDGDGYIGLLTLKINDSFGNSWEELTFTINFENIRAHHYNLETIPVSADPYSVTLYNTTTSVENINNPLVEVFPNPVENGILRFTADNQIDEVILHSIQGGLIFSTKRPAKEGIRLPGDIDSGLYFVRIILEDNSVFTKKLVIR